MKLLKGCKVRHEWFLKNTSPSNKPSSMLLLELTKPEWSRCNYSAISATWSHLLLTTRMFQNQKWNLEIINILVVHEYKTSYIHGHVCLYTHRHKYMQTNHIFTHFIFFFLINNNDNINSIYIYKMYKKFKFQKGSRNLIKK